MENKYTEHINNRSILRECIPLQKPLAVYLDTSGICNFECSICVVSLNAKERPASRSFMKMPLFQKIIKDFQSWEGPKIKVLYPFSGGESLLNPDFPEMLRIIKEADIAEKIELVTNASYLTEDIAKSLIENELDFLRISIYAVDQEKHEKITKSNIDVNQIYNNVKRLSDLKKQMGAAKPVIYIKMIDSLSKDNDLFFEKYEPLADEIHLEDVFNWNDYAGTRVYDFIRNTYDEESAKIMKDRYNSRINESKKKCHQPFYHLNIASNGNIGVCCSDWAGEIQIGNASEVPLKELWNNEQVESLRKTILRGEQNKIRACQNCSLYKLTNHDSDNIDSLTEEEYMKRVSKIYTE